jgi:hypothetical protein
VAPMANMNPRALQAIKYGRNWKNKYIAAELHLCPYLSHP